MKRISALLVLIVVVMQLCAQTGSGQEKPKKKSNNVIEITAAVSLPFGKYAAEDKSEFSSGYAGTGWIVKAGFNWMGNRGFGLGFQYAFQQNPFTSAADSVYPEGVHDSTYFMGPGKWTNNYLLAGPVFLKRFKKLHVDVKVLAGVVLSASKSFTTTNPGAKENNANTGTGFAIQVSAGVGYAISDHFAIKVSADLLSAWPAKNKQYGSMLVGYEEYLDPVTGKIIEQPVYSAPVEYNIKRVINTLNPGIGFIYYF
jgi:opacity protein-like surface antigen